MSIPQRLKSIRLQKGLNQADFGEMLDTNGQSIADIETGKKKIGIKLLENLQVKMGIDLNWLITGAGKTKYIEKSIPENIHEPSASETKWLSEKMGLLEENRNLNNENRVLRGKIENLEGKGGALEKDKPKLYR